MANDRNAEGPRRSRQVPGPQPLQGAGAGAVRARRVRQRPREGRRHRAAGLEEKAYLAKSNCPEFAVEVIETVGGETMSQRPPGQGLGHRLRSSRSALGQRPVPDLGRAAAASARSPTPTASWASTCRPATRTCARSPTTPSISPRAAWWCARRRRRAMPGAAHHLRPAGAPPGAHGAAAAVHARRHRRSSSRGRAAICQRADRQVHRPRQLRRGGRVRAGDPGARHRPHAGPARGATAISTASGSTRSSRTASPTTASLMQAVGEMTHYFMGHVHERTEKPGDDLISYLRATPSSTASRMAEEHVGRLAAAAADRRHRHDLERDRLVPLAPGQDARRTAAGWSRSPR